jgi:hypothetical protein
MSKQIHDEQQRRKQVKFRADEQLVGEFDNSIGDQNRSEKLRELMQEVVGGPSADDTPLMPPTDETLAEAYRHLCDVANRDGIIREDTALSVLSSRLGRSKTEIRHTVLKNLDGDGYLIPRHSYSGRNGRAWKLSGVE